jgi:glycosyltransferase involved in cell wall biosynthesis
VRILLWHVHGSWTTSFVQGRHTYLLPRLPERGPDGMGRATTWDWPASAVEVAPGALREEEVDLVVLQRPHELELAERLLGRRLGGLGDVPAVYLEHNTPKGDVPATRHPLAGRSDVPLVHVTHFNELFWDSGSAPTTVIEHGIVDPGYRYTGELARAGVAVNEPVRRGRVTGTDLLPRLARAVPVDVYGMRVEGLPAHLGLDADRLAVHEDLPQAAMHAELARRRVYAHPLRWTSLGLSLLEAMSLGMPVVALATTEAVEAVPLGAGVVTTRVDTFVEAVRRFAHDPEWAAAAGKEARSAAQSRYGLERFLGDWDRLLVEVTR